MELELGLGYLYKHQPAQLARVHRTAVHPVYCPESMQCRRVSVRQGFLLLRRRLDMRALVRRLRALLPKL